MDIGKIKKAIAGLSAFLGFFLLLGCVWTLTSVIYRDFHPSNSSNTTFAKKQLRITGGGKKPINIVYHTEEQYSQTYTTAHDISDEQNEQPKDLYFHFQYMPQFFKGIIIGCCCVAIIAALLQLGSSLVLLLSAPQNVSRCVKYFVALHFVTFVILLVAFFAAATYDRVENKYYSMTGFNVKVMQSFKDFNKNFINFLWYDLNTFYTFISADLAFVFFTMISVCCLMRFDKYDDYKYTT